MRAYGFNQLIAHFKKRVETGQRILENGPDLLAPNLPHGIIGKVVDPATIQIYPSVGNPSGRFQQAENRRAGQGFAGARFSHHPQNLSGIDVQRDIIHSHQSSPAGGKFDPKILNFK